LRAKRRRLEERYAPLVQIRLAVDLFSAALERMAARLDGEIAPGAGDAIRDAAYRFNQDAQTLIPRSGHDDDD
jgi:hypothetical protein